MKYTKPAFRKLSSAASLAHGLCQVGDSATHSECASGTNVGTFNCNPGSTDLMCHDGAEAQGYCSVGEVAFQ
jgi:hypothetical protein